MMSLIRARLVSVAVAAFLCHAVAVLAPPVAICCTALASALASEETTCNCGHGPNAMCPMHKGAKKTSPAEDHREGAAQWCTGHDTPDHATVALFSFEPCVTEDCPKPSQPSTDSARLADLVAHAHELSRPPSLPPPRG